MAQAYADGPLNARAVALAQGTTSKVRLEAKQPGRLNGLGWLNQPGGCADPLHPSRLAKKNPPPARPKGASANGAQVRSAPVLATR